MTQNQFYLAVAELPEVKANAEMNEVAQNFVARINAQSQAKADKKNADLETIEKIAVILKANDGMTTKEVVEQLDTNLTSQKVNFLIRQIEGVTSTEFRGLKVYNLN